MTTADRIAALEASIRDAQATLAKLAAEEATDEPAADETPVRRVATAADGREAARRRHPGRTRSELAAVAGTGTGDAAPVVRLAATAADGRREAQRRAALRGGAA